MARIAAAVGVVTASLATAVAAAGCGKVLVPSYTVPAVNSAWQAQLVAGGLTKPRSLMFDASGALLVVESGKGITRHKIVDNGGTCVSISESTVLIGQTSLNHGLALSKDGKTLYASTVDTVYAWLYDPEKGTTGSVPRAIVSGMANDDLVTRTLLISGDNLIVSRGSSDPNKDKASILSNGLSQVRMFDLSNVTTASKAYSFNSEGTVLGWGLRNSVGIGEHPVTGGIFGVENSVDGVTRNGKDIHENNPGEELNFLGFVNGTGTGNNFGYPHCYAVWDAAEIPDGTGLRVGDQFAQTENSTLTDETCQANYTAPRLTLPAHYAPLDIKFSQDGGEAYVSFHGSFDKTDPVGYSIATIPFDAPSGQPVGSPTDQTAFTEIMTNPDHSKCPTNCFRPVGLVVDAAGRVWFTSDTTGEIYVLQKAGNQGTATTSGTIVTATAAASAADPGVTWRGWGWQSVLVAWAGAILLGIVFV
ncbi:soluble quino protein glucose/sorbosone dehydrogenase [Echria macrotheca]|uniref:Soluble quino protein glucose/sorbosone dehydrogenase n=1 Tax=Echria macrotheca TaxID=438768 RepID=A0AAJ0BMN0_9PEZI|nr:soluble quino protein glucose/sorbosone dehydrogenase [Echria macrotheca]